MGLSYRQLGKNDLAEAAIKEARDIQPDDVSLLLNEADLYIRISNNSDNDDDRLLYRNKFKNLMEKAIELDPENGILYYNLGVIYAEQGELELAKEKYSQAIKFIPDYVDAYLNLVSVILEDEVAIVEEMNSLGNSKKDNLRYDELKESRENLYRECVPLLQELIKVSPSNIDALNTLKNIYGVLGENEAFMQVKAMIEELESNYEFEPDEDEILSNLLPKNISTQIFKAMLENSASEQGSRMTAMDNATRNAGDLVDKLTIQYNRSRQAAITKELIEIISGAESL